MTLLQHEEGETIIFSYPLLSVSGLHLSNIVYRKCIYFCGKDGTRGSYEGWCQLPPSQLFEINREKHQGREDGESVYNLSADLSSQEILAFRIIKRGPCVDGECL